MFRAIDLWLPSWLGRSRKSLPPPEHVIISICDHFEPFHGADKQTAIRRVQHWRTKYPEVTAGLYDADGVLPRHTFFYPIEQNDPDVLSGIQELCENTGCEVEVHLHHKDDTADNLRATLERGKREFQHYGFLSHDETGAVRYGFIHGNWALDNSDPHGRFCGVSDELGVLAETGCFADFTMPAAPNCCQTRTINSIYYAKDTAAPKSHDRGTPATAGVPGTGGLLMIQGPLAPNWRRRKWGLLPRIENGELTTANPPTLDRLAVWMECAVHVLGAPEWLFVKLHTHGAIERNSTMLLGPAMRKFREELKNQPFKTHSVSAREMANLVLAAEAGKTGDPGQYRDYRYQRP